MATETWYVLADGTYADPNQCHPGKDGVLRHENGVPVAVGEHGNPMTISIDADAERKSKGKTRQIEAEKPEPGYQTRAVRKGKG